MHDLPPDLMALFAHAGWKPDRRARTAPGLPADHPARSILEAFSGLQVGKNTTGVECAAGDVVFTGEIHAPAEIQEIQRLSGERLIAIGRTHADYAVLHIGASGRCFGTSDMMETPWFAGETFVEAIRSIVTGRCVRPILLPGQASATFYGDVYRAGDPRLYDLGSGR
ncbi:SUKH-3 domain-containing protein [Caulobacter hibisci]|uniref:SUKH-3 domain-containing protein n=1 Tax=Caulobacter hibisci TaxID=2035993 RepID=A0ABS0T395_9CAUL|nr:SUKH-3 domain-containing protein [Caulobacter hibisci]MBI1686304.1 SUKH-3 domain-containing protein [Caulobacter hibisci]